MAKGSLSELITQIEICSELYPELIELINPLLNLSEEINRMIIKLIKQLKLKL
ncbi:MAG: four helix bundle protein [Candidatus Riflebacteria bacterium]|nr:four helix bundle protein [Candidatus Riflebacteria bacterium]MBR4569433.1 four helix bundle protein [Candidatus Riflebacteria bacterium]